MRALTSFLDAPNARPVRCVVPAPRLQLGASFVEALRRAFSPSQDEKELAG